MRAFAWWYTENIMKRTYLFWGIAALAAAVAAVWYIHGASIPVLQPAGPVALAERRIMIITVLFCAIIVVPVFVLLFYFAWRYRAGNPRAEKSHAPDWDHDNAAIEASWWIAPAIIILFLAVLAWRSSYALDPYKPLKSAVEPLTVQVVALDWKWLFIYPEQGIASVNLLEIPENVPIRLEMTADAPMNSFWIPQLAGQIMVMPGMQTQLNLMASRTGDFNGLSGNISGEGFAGMAFTARSVTPDDFEQWVAGAKSAAKPLTLAAYDELAKPSSYDAPMQYAPVDATLFTAIIDRVMMPSSMMGSMDMPNATMP